MPMHKNGNFCSTRAIIAFFRMCLAYNIMALAEAFYGDTGAKYCKKAGNSFFW